jgi:hypothetical protein
MTSPSKFEVGDTVWEAWAYVNSANGGPSWRIRRGTWGQTTDGFALIRLDDGRAERVIQTKDYKVFGTHQEAVRHCSRIFWNMTAALRVAISGLEELNEPGDPAAASVSAAGTAPPEVAS